MSSDNSNIVIGLISAIALVAGLIYTFSSIHKTRLEIRKLNLELQRKGRSSKKPSSSSKQQASISPRALGLILEVVFFLVFFISSVTAIVEYLHDRLPTFAIISVQIFILIYSFLLMRESLDRSLAIGLFSEKEEHIFTGLSIIGAVTAIIFIIALGMRRLTSIISPDRVPDVLDKLFPLAVNLAPAPLIAFSIVSLHRLIKYMTNILSRD